MGPLREKVFSVQSVSSVDDVFMNNAGISSKSIEANDIRRMSNNNSVRQLADAKSKQYPTPAGSKDPDFLYENVFYDALLVNKKPIVLHFIPK